MRVDEYEAKANARAEKARIRARLWAQRYPERNRARVAAWAKANPERAKHSASVNYRKNAKARKEKARAWAVNNPGKRKIICAKSNKRHPDTRRAICAKRRAVKRKSPGKYTAADIRNIFKNQCGKCNVCGIDIAKQYEVDHAMPLARGGSNWPDNIQLLCRPCNRSKGAKLPGEWNGRT